MNLKHLISLAALFLMTSNVYAQEYRVITISEDPSYGLLRIQQGSTLLTPEQSLELLHPQLASQQTKVQCEFNILTILVGEYPSGPSAELCEQTFEDCAASDPNFFGGGRCQLLNDYGCQLPCD